MAYQAIAKNGEIYHISPQYWQQNQQQQALLLRYFALPLKEDEHHLWLAVDSLNNLAACETFAFLSGKLVEPILFETTQLKQLLQSLAPKANQIEEQTTFYHHSEDENTANLANDDEPVIQLLNGIFEATYKMPLLKNPLNYYYEFSTGYEKENKNDTDTKALTFAALRYWNNSEGWQYFAGLRVRYDSYTQADFTDKTFLVYPTGGFNRTRLRGGQFPTWGDTQKITVDLGNKLWMSEANFFKVQASTAWIRTYAENHRFITRAEIGYLNTADIRKIPPALRFFAGGDRSVRGYGYKKISPKNKDGKLVGGSRLVTGSLEYQYQVYPNWWGAVFADTGLAANSYKATELRYGAGVGVRWASPIGAIKFDIATPIRDKDNSKNIQFYIGLGAEI